MPYRTRASKVDSARSETPTLPDMIAASVRQAIYDMNDITEDTKAGDIPEKLIANVTNPFLSICPSETSPDRLRVHPTVTTHLTIEGKQNKKNQMRVRVDIDDWSQRVFDGKDGQEKVWSPSPTCSAVVTAEDRGKGWTITSCPESFTPGHVALLPGAWSRLQDATEDAVSGAVELIVASGAAVRPSELTKALHRSLGPNIPKIVAAFGPLSTKITCCHGIDKDGQVVFRFGTKDPSRLSAGQVYTLEAPVSVSLLNDGYCKVTTPSPSLRSISSLIPEHQGSESGHNYREVSVQLDEAFQAIQKDFLKVSEGAGDTVPEFSHYFIPELSKGVPQVAESIQVSADDRDRITSRTSFQLDPLTGTRTGSIFLRNQELDPNGLNETKIELTVGFDPKLGEWEPSMVVKDQLAQRFSALSLGSERMSE